MKIVLYSVRSYEKIFFEKLNRKNGFNLDIQYLSCRLNKNTIEKSNGSKVICTFIHDMIDEEILQFLFISGVRLIALRCTGFDHVDLESAKKIGIKVVHVPGYSPESIAEYAVSLILYASRGLYLSSNEEIEEVRDTLKDQVIGVIGTGRIGSITLKILKGFGSKLLAYDPIPNREIVSETGINYVSMDDLLSYSHIISLHCPLNQENYHLINKDSCQRMKDGVILINTSRGELIDSESVLLAMKSGKIRFFCSDVFEKEYFLENENNCPLKEEHQVYKDIFRSFKKQRNFFFTRHRAFLTKSSLRKIAKITLSNINDFRNGSSSLKYELT
ncbi:NAD(P)-dependent oxidoreductase [Candidatus Riesia pediculicola]|uniref:NAD(P)-dependent oxidoreductase n=1 Tax=Candidatus Riesia pediculicola TaxID=401619 RepID=UPI0009B7A817|nr:NAD(P)-dependent oxidoreductase [Candidatus Riesia pediculicola]ARC53762.1 hypothetical protein AOE55_01175 [Candidatus Riesia pediculicola]